MSDDERGPPRKGRKGKGRDDDDFGGKGKKGGGGGGRKGGGGSAGGGSGSSGPEVSRLKVVPKFLQAMMDKSTPEQAKRGLSHATLADKRAEIGRNDDDEYDIEGAQVVGSDFTAEDVQAQTLKKEVFSRTSTIEKKTFFAAEAKRPAEGEDESGPVRFRGKADRSLKLNVAAADGPEDERKRAKGGFLGIGHKAVNERPPGGKYAQQVKRPSEPEKPAPPTKKKKQVLSFDGDEEDM
eukprot:gnl/TRDRNA2_/TRDRNA2_35349_c0_seq1.p1 gnl/TRDRNA2_/TRDRNA2_35349_c0~~gnl/TRDRNA2_/TRDRNA2_35349_c0_seq1.p1  ORF type:complete len:238 (+),score=70.29 gnl/TRDRNA2_/TRDRNA2_35349_c0_seq1:29-742(+)